AMKFAVLHDLTPSNITTQTVTLQFGIERLGQTPGNFTLTVTPVSSNIASITSPATQTGMSVLEQRNVTAVMQLNSNIGFDEEIKYRVKLSNEDHDIYEAEIVKVFSPQVAFFDNAEAGNLNNWTTAGGTWVNTNSTAFNGSRSFTDAVAVAYSNNLNKSITLTNPVNLQAPFGKTLTKILVQFYAKWDLERNFDFIEFQGSTDGATWVSLNGLYNKPSAKADTNDHVNKLVANEQFQQNGTLVYDGDQMDKWVMEEIVIDSTQNNFLFESPTARFRFLFRTDGTNLTDNYTTSFDGFFFDDFTVLKIVEPPTLSVVDNQLETIKISPNPFKNNIQVSWPELSGEGFTATLFDLQGRLIKQQTFDNGSVQTLPIDASLSRGLYLLKLESKDGRTHTEKLVKN
ncbi:MAG: T9SS type A sorting domain-containing protein, partial [Flavobacteriaceae bacterium]|nr:T9SS type A sorting domain-containing protein [Flavobacteriaceae bacterium]